MDDTLDWAATMTRFMRFCISVILGVIALILIIRVLLVLAYVGFMGWAISTDAFNSKPSTSPPPKAALHQSVKPCPPPSRTPPGTVLRHDCDYSSQGPVR